MGTYVVYIFLNINLTYVFIIIARLIMLKSACGWWKCYLVIISECGRGLRTGVCVTLPILLAIRIDISHSASLKTKCQRMVHFADMNLEIYFLLLLNIMWN